MVDDGYQIFWDGRPIGGVGQFGLHPLAIGARPFLARLPPSSGDATAPLAIRVFVAVARAMNIGVTLTQYALARALPLLCFALTADGRRRARATTA